MTEWAENGDGFKREVITGYKHTEHLKKKLASYGCIFMKTSEVLELPEQTEQKIFFKSTQAYKYFTKNSYLLFDTLNYCKFDDSDSENENPCIELVGDNSLTKCYMPGSYAGSGTRKNWKVCGTWLNQQKIG